MKENLPKPYVFSVEQVSDSNGHLHFLENKQFPFEVKRAFWITKVPEGSIRGVHAHRSDRQLTFCLQGKVAVNLEDLSGESYHVILDEPSKVLYLPPLVWSEFTFEAGAILMVLAGEDFSEADYIRDKKEFEMLQDGYRE